MYGKNWRAHRIAWIIENNKSLPTWHRVYRTCRTKDCVRPSHLKRDPRNKPKGLKGKLKNEQYVIQLGNTNVPSRPRKKYHYSDFESYVIGLQGFTESVNILSGKITQLEKQVAHLANIIKENNNKELFVTLSGRVGAIDQRLGSFSTRVEDLLERVPQELIVQMAAARLDPSPPPPEPTPVTDVAVAPEPEPEPEPEPDEPSAAPVGDLHETIMRAFQAEMGGPRDPTDEDREALSVAFEMAIASSEDVGGAVRLFAAWLDSFRKLTASEDLERTPVAFAAKAVSRSLSS